MADKSLLLSVNVTYDDMIIRWASLQLQALDILDGKSLSQVRTHACAGVIVLCALTEISMQTQLCRELVEQFKTGKFSKRTVWPATYIFQTCRNLKSNEVSSVGC